MTNLFFFFANSESSTTADAFETSDLPILFSISEMVNLGITVELDPKGNKITCEHSTMRLIVLDLTNFAYQSTTKSREQSGRPKRHVILRCQSDDQPAWMKIKMRMINHLCDHPSATLKHEVAQDSRGRKAEGEALRNNISKLSEERNLRDLHLKHYHMFTAQFKKRTIHLDVPRKNCVFYQHVVKTCPFCKNRDWKDLA